MSHRPNALVSVTGILLIALQKALRCFAHTSFTLLRKFPILLRVHTAYPWAQTMLVHMVFRKSIISQARNKAINCPPESGPNLTCIFFFFFAWHAVAKFSSFYISRSIMLTFKTLLLKILGELQSFRNRHCRDSQVQNLPPPTPLNFTMRKHFINPETTQHCDPDESHGHWHGDSVSRGSWL